MYVGYPKVTGTKLREAEFVVYCIGSIELVLI